MVHLKFSKISVPSSNPQLILKKKPKRIGKTIRNRFSPATRETHSKVFTNHLVSHIYCSSLKWAIVFQLAFITAKAGILPLFYRGFLNL